MSSDLIDFGSGAAGGAASGAAAGTMVMPGIGTLVGAGLGGLLSGAMGLFQGSRARQEQKKQEALANLQRQRMLALANKGFEAQYKQMDRYFPQQQSTQAQESLARGENPSPAGDVDARSSAGELHMENLKFNQRQAQEATQRAQAQVAYGADYAQNMQEAQRHLQSLQTAQDMQRQAMQSGAGGLGSVLMMAGSPSPGYGVAGPSAGAMS
jgi:hypothetical protein